MPDMLKKIEDYVGLLDCTRRKVVLDIMDIARYDPHLAEYVVENLEEVLSTIEHFVADKYAELSGEKKEVYVYIKPSNTIEILEWANAHAKYTGKLRRVWGTVISISPMEFYSCRFYYCDCCNKNFVSYITRKKCVFCQMQTLTLKEEKKFCYRDLSLLEQKENALSQEKIKCRIFLPHDKAYGIVDLYNLLGHKIEVAGYLEHETLYKKDEGKQIKTIRFIVKGISTKEVIKLSEDDKVECRNYIKEHKDDLLDILRNEIWYGTFGYEYERKLLLLHAIGLHPKDGDLDNRSKQMCIMLISDKGRNKSQMAKALLKFFPDGGMVTASSSYAGLIIGLEKTSGGEYTAVLGDIPACNNSICILEEVDKLRDEELSGLLTVLSDGFIKTSKIKKFHMDCHINFITLANPVHGHFDLQMQYWGQIDMPEPFLDRMDTMIILPKAYDDDNKMDFASKVLNPKKGVERKLDDDFVKKLLYYMKHFLPNPKLTDEGEFAIAKKWESLEKMQNNPDKVADTKTIEARTLVSLLKICKAYGRIHLFDEITAEVVDKAYELYMKGCMNRWLSDYGTPNIQTFVANSQTKSRRVPNNDDERRQYIINLLEAKEGGVDVDELIKILKDRIGLPTVKIQNLIKTLLEHDELSESRGILKRKWSRGVEQEYISDVAETFDIRKWIADKLGEEALSDIEIAELAKAEHQLTEDVVFKTLDTMKRGGEIMENRADGKWRVV